MTAPAETPAQARRILELARNDRAAAQEALAALDLEAQLALVCETPVARRAELLELAPHPEALIPALPEAELCFTVKAVGLADASWMLEYATDSQLVTCIDLDAWSGLTPERATLAAWIDALAAAGEETLLRGAHALDPDLLVLHLQTRVEVMLKTNDDDWEPPPGAQTLDGQFYFRARAGDDDLGAFSELMHGLFQADYWLYFRLMQGVIWEVETEMEEWALRWRSGRLSDLGFPEWEEAMRIYGFVRPEERAQLPEEAKPLDVEAWRLPVWLPRLPIASDAQHLVFQAAAQLTEAERSAFLYAFVSLANKVAVADRLPLGDVESTPRAIEKAAQHTSRGLAYVASQHGVDATEVLRRASLERLFRVGASLDRDAIGPVGSRA